MTAAKDILKLSQTMNALAIAGDSFKLANKKNKTTKDFVGYGTKSIIGTSLMKANASFIGEID